MVSTKARNISAEQIAVNKSKAENLLKSQIEHRKELPYFLTLARASNISPDVVSLFETEMNRKVPFDASHMNSQQLMKAWPGVVELIQQLIDRSPVLQEAFDTYFDSLSQSPFPGIASQGLHIGFILHYFGPGEGIEHIIENKTKNDIFEEIA